MNWLCPDESQHKATGIRQIARPFFNNLAIFQNLSNVCFIDPALKHALHSVNAEDDAIVPHSIENKQMLHRLQNRLRPQMQVIQHIIRLAAALGDLIDVEAFEF